MIDCLPPLPSHHIPHTLLPWVLSSVPWGEGSLCPKWALVASQSRLALPPPWDFLLSLLGFSQSTVLVHQFILKESKFSLISSFWLLYFGDVAGSWLTRWEKASSTPKSPCFLVESVWEIATKPFTELKKTQEDLA